MIGHVWFERLGLDSSSGAEAAQETIRPWEDYGLYLVSYDAPPPKPKVYRAAIEGRDGALDLTEWEGSGIVRYNDRTVTISLRDMGDRSRAFVGKMLGQRFNIRFEDEPGWFYQGRCEDITTKTRRRVTDLDLTFTCKPFRYSEESEHVTYSVAHGTKTETSAGHYIITPTIETYTLTIEGGAVTPTFTAAGVDTPYSLPNRIIIFNSGVWGEGLYSEHEITSDGVINTGGAVLTAGDNLIRLFNYNETETMTVTVTWRQGVI